MSSKKTFAVAMIGIPDNERHILKNIFKLSLYRTQTYAIVSSKEPSQILIVDADDPKAMAEWHACCGAASQSAFPGQDSKMPIPAVMVTREKLSGELPYYIRRPFVASRVLGVLDQVASKELGGNQQSVLSEEKKQTVPTSEEWGIFRALIVDQSKLVRNQIELELNLFGVHVDTVESGEKAFELIDQNNYDMVFLDIVLPGIDGYQVCKSIKKKKTKKRTHVIIITNKSSPFDRVKGALAGCDIYLTKPLKRAFFQKVIQKYLSK